MQLTLKIPKPPVIQIALDYATIDEALEMARIGIEAGVDWLEIGTPLIVSPGGRANRYRPSGDQRRRSAGRAFRVRPRSESGVSTAHEISVSQESFMATADIGVVNYGPAKYSVELREIPKPKIGPDEVLLEVA